MVLFCQLLLFLLSVYCSELSWSLFNSCQSLCPLYWSNNTAVLPNSHRLRLEGLHLSYNPVVFFFFNFWLWWHSKKYILHHDLVPLVYTIIVSVAQSNLTLSDPMESSPPGCSAHGILQTTVLEWVAMPSSRGLSQPRDRIEVSCIAGRFFTVWATQEASSIYTI